LLQGLDVVAELIAALTHAVRGRVDDLLTEIDRDPPATRGKRLGKSQQSDAIAGRSFIELA